MSNHVPSKTGVKLFSSCRDWCASFGSRFALRWWDVIVIVAVAVFVTCWVSVSDRRTTEGLLGRPLRVGIVPWPGYIGGLVANNGRKSNKDSIFWQERHGRRDGLLVEFVFVENLKKLQTAFENDEVDVMWSTVDALAYQLPAFAKDGKPAQAFMQVDWSRGGDAIIAINDISRVEDLKGEKIAVSMAPSKWLLEYSLEHSGLKGSGRDTIEFVTTTGSSEARDKYVSGEVNAAVLWEPDVTEALVQRPGHHLIDTAMAPNLIADVMVAKKDFIQKHRPVIAAFIEGWFDGTAKTMKDPEHAARLFSWVLQDFDKNRFESITEEKARELLGMVTLATLDDNAGMFGFSAPEPLFDQIYEQAAQLWVKKTDVDVVRSADARYTEVLKELYVQQIQCSVRMGSGPPVMTPEVTVEFQPGSAELSNEAKQVLDRDATFLVGAYSGILFRVEAYGDNGTGSLAAKKTRSARANAVNDYLAQHCTCSRRHFVSGEDITDNIMNHGQAPKYIRLKLINAAQADNDKSLHSTP